MFSSTHSDMSTQASSFFVGSGRVATPQELIAVNSPRPGSQTQQRIALQQKRKNSDADIQSGLWCNSNDDPPTKRYRLDNSLDDIGEVCIPNPIPYWMENLSKSYIAEANEQTSAASSRCSIFSYGPMLRRHMLGNSSDSSVILHDETSVNTTQHSLRSLSSLASWISSTSLDSSSGLSGLSAFSLMRKNKEWLAAYPTSSSSSVRSANSTPSFTNEEASDVELSQGQVEEVVGVASVDLKSHMVPAGMQKCVEDILVSIPKVAGNAFVWNKTQKVRTFKLSNDFWQTAEYQPKVLMHYNKADTIPPLQIVESTMKRKATRSMAANHYNDLDENQNQLIGMERSFAHSTRVALADRPMPKKEKFKLFQMMCKDFKLPTPLPIEKFETMDWNYVPKCDEKKLAHNLRFKTPAELQMIPRRHPRFPFCHPGPVRDDNLQGNWFYADSIVEELKFVGLKETFYNVRWIGYEDEYNTVEEERYLKGSAILILFQRPKIFPASQASGPLMLRRSMRVKEKMFEGITTTKPMLTKTIPTNIRYAQAMTILDQHLAVEEKEGRYLPSLGFISCANIVMSLNSQLDFTEKIFHLIIRNLERPEYHLSTKYLGNFFGGLRDKKLRKQFKNKAVDAPETVKKNITDGLKKAKTDDNTPQFVSFFVATKRHGTQKASDNNLDMHMCVYTVRSYNGIKDAIYFDPAAPCHERSVPNFLLKLRQPALRSATVKRGRESQANDCLHQCFQYLIGLQTGEITFEPNFNSNYFIVNNDV